MSAAERKGTRIRLVECAKTFPNGTRSRQRSTLAPGGAHGSGSGLRRGNSRTLAARVVAAGTASTLKVDAKGRPLPPELMFAGKTGTAQVKRITERERDMGITQQSLPWHLRHLALFVCWGPIAKPRYACAVIVEHGMAGGATAGPIGRDVLVETMKRDPSRRIDGFKKMASR